MKVRSTGPAKGTSKTGSKSSTSSSNGAFSSMMSDQTPEAATPAATQSIAQLDALLAIQGAEDPTERESRGRMITRADKTLDLLDTVRDKMLGGGLTVGDMIDVADVVASHREKISDPKLTDLMDEVDLRAQVEIAKMRVVLDNKK